MYRGFLGGSRDKVKVSAGRDNAEARLGLLLVMHDANHVAHLHRAQRARARRSSIPQDGHLTTTKRHTEAKGRKKNNMWVRGQRFGRRGGGGG